MPRRKPSTTPRKQPRTARSQAVVDAIVEGAARVLQAEGPAALTTNRVAEVAGVSVGSLYQYFPNKQAVVAALIERRLAEDLTWARALMPLRDAEPPAAWARRVVDGMCERQRQAAPLMAGLLALLDEADRAAAARRMVDTVTDELRAALLERPALLRPELRDPEALEIALFVGARAVRWASNEALLERPALLDDPRFRAELARVVGGVFAVAAA